MNATPATSKNRRDRWVVIGLTAVLGLGLLAVSFAAAAVMLWLLGPIVTVLFCVLGLTVYLAVRAAVRR